MSRQRADDQRAGGTIHALPDSSQDPEGLTTRQRRVLEVIRDALERRGYPPTMREIGKAAGLASPSSVSHQLHALEATDPMYCAYFTVLAGYVKHHIRQEEQELFPRVEKMQELDLDQLGEDMRLRREELFAEMERGDDEAEASQDLEASDESGEADVEEAQDEELEDEQEQIDISRTRH